MSDFPPPSLPASRSSILPRLSVLLFLQFFIWGSWYLTVSLYMYEYGMGAVRFYAYTAGPLGAIIAPFITGLIADRFFNTERVLAVLFFLAGVSMLMLPVVGAMSGTPVAFESGNDGEQIVVAESITFLGMTMSKGALFNYTILAHMICYMPTLGLTASLSFHHLPKGSTQFPLVRLWGTLGWIVAGLVLGLLGRQLAGGAADQPVQFYLGGGASIGLALYCLMLPRTPAPKKGEPIDFASLLFMDAWREFRRVPFAVFIIGSCLVCIPLAAYYASLQQQLVAMEFDADWIPIVKNVGTWIEAGMMFAMPFLLRKYGFRWIIIIGILAWIVRYGLFAGGANVEVWGKVLVITGIALHGFCYDFFFVAGQVYVDRATPANIRGQAQGMNIFFTQGIGLFFGALVVNELSLWAFADGAGGTIASNTAASLPHWPKVWLPLAALAAGILVVFAIAFRDNVASEDVDESEVAEAAETR